MSSEDAIAVVLKFEELINSRKADAVASLFSDDSIFIDSWETVWRERISCIKHGRVIFKWSLTIPSRTRRFLLKETLLRCLGPHRVLSPTRVN